MIPVANITPDMTNYPSISLPMMIQSAPVVPTGAYDKTLASFIFVEGAVTGAPNSIFLVCRKIEKASDSSSIPQQLHEIKSKLGLNLSQLSKILDVSRPQLYKWLEGKVLPQREGFNQKIAELHSWLNLIPEEHSKYFGKLANRNVSGKQTVIDILTDQNLDKDKLLAVYDSIKSDIEAIDNRKAKERNKLRSNEFTEVILPPK